MDIILYLLQIIQQLYKQNCWLINFICKYIPLKQWAFDDSHSPKYQKFKIDKLPKIVFYEQWDYRDYIPYLEWKYGKKIKPVNRHGECDIDDNCTCPRCNAPKPFLYKNNGSKGQILCKVCSTVFSPQDNRFSKPYTLKCPHCNHSLVHKKDRKHFVIHKCVNRKCPYYLHNLKKIDSKDLQEDYGKNKYKLHYIYREFQVDFFRMDLNSLPKNASSLKFSKHNAHVMSLCLTMHVNLGLSLRKTAQALKDLYNISISHQQVANYCKTAALCIKPFVDNYDYHAGNVFTADETYIKIRGVKSYICSLWMPPSDQSSDIRSLITEASVHASLPCGWLSGISRNSLSISVLSPTDTVPTLWLPNSSSTNTVKSLSSISHRSSVLRMMTKYPKNFDRTNR